MREIRQDGQDLMGALDIVRRRPALKEALVSPAAAVGRRRLSGTVLPREDAPGQRAVADHADALVPAERQQLHLDHAIDQVVARLDAVEPHHVSPVTQPERPRQLPGGEVAAAQVAHLTPPHQVIQRVERLFQWGRGIPGMDLIQVDIVRLQAPQAGLDLLEDRRAGEPLSVRPLSHPAPDLGRQDHSVAPAVQGLADDLLAAAAAVDVRGVQKVDPRVERAVDHTQGEGLVGLIAEGHAAQAQLRDFDAGAAHAAVVHTASFSNGTVGSSLVPAITRGNSAGTARSTPGA